MHIHSWTVTLVMELLGWVVWFGVGVTIDFREGKLFLLSTTVSIAGNADSVAEQWVGTLNPFMYISYTFIALTVTSVMELLGLDVWFGVGPYTLERGQLFLLSTTVSIGGLFSIAVGTCFELWTLKPFLVEEFRSRRCPIFSLMKFRSRWKLRWSHILVTVTISLLSIL